MAEGVETETQARALRYLDCDESLAISVELQDQTPKENPAEAVYVSLYDLSKITPVCVW